jgi:positive regulator of sigma E activity
LRTVKVSSERVSSCASCSVNLLTGFGLGVKATGAGKKGIEIPASTRIGDKYVLATTVVPAWKLPCVLLID